VLLLALAVLARHLAFTGGVPRCSRQRVRVWGHWNWAEEPWDGKISVGAQEEWGWGACHTEEGQGLEELVKLGLAPDIDEKFEAVVEKLNSDGDNIDASFEGALAMELLERRRADLVYLAVVRKYKSWSIPGLKTFQGTGNKTWAMCGGLQKWVGCARKHALGVYVPNVNATVKQTARQAIVGGNEEAKMLMDAYLDIAASMANGKHVVTETPLTPFLIKLQQAIREATLSVGGASGLPDRNRTAEEAPVDLPSLESAPGDDAPEEDRTWFEFYVEVLDNTRVVHADVYLSHVYFGICLQRLARRFQLAKMAGLLPELPDVVLQRARLESSWSGTSNLEIERFKEWLEAQETSDILSVSPTMLAAARRQTDAIFGRGLREELFAVLTEASQAAAWFQKPSVETCTPLLVNAGAMAEIRMLSLGPMARERLAWDGVIFGAMLVDAAHLVGDDAA